MTTVSPKTYQNAGRSSSSNLTRSMANPTAPVDWAATRDFPWGRPGSIRLRGRNVARPRFSARRSLMHSSAT